MSTFTLIVVKSRLNDFAKHFKVSALTVLFDAEHFSILVLCNISDDES